MTTPNYLRRTILTFGLMGLLTPVVLLGVFGALQHIVNAPLNWLSNEHPSRQAYNRFISSFQTLETITISWPGCKLANPQLKELSAELKSGGHSPSGQLYSQYIKDVITVDSLVESLAAERTDLSEKKVKEEVAKRLEGTLVSRDGETTCALIILTIDGSIHGPSTIETVLEAAEKTIGLSRDEFHLAGSTIDGVAIDDASNKSVIYFVFSMILSILICWYCLRSAVFTASVIAVAGFGAGFSYAMVYFLGVDLNAVLMVMAPLVFVLTISAGVHLVNYYRDEVRYRGLQGAAQRTLRVGWQPCALAAGTTAIGLASLMVSTIQPVFYFGLIATVSVSLTLALLLLTLPGVMEFWGGRVAKPMTLKGEAVAGQAGIPGAATFFGLHWLPIVLVFVSVMVITGFGLPQVKTSVNVTDLLASNSKTIRDYRWMEDNLGPLIPVEVLVHFDRSCPLNVVKRVELLQMVESRIRDQIGLKLVSVDDAVIIEQVLPGGNASRRGFFAPGDEIVSVGEGAEGETFDIQGASASQVERWLVERKPDTIRLGVRHDASDRITHHKFKRERMGIMSAATFVPKIPPARKVAMRAALNVMLENDLPGFSRTGMLSQSEKEETWRITVRVPVFDKHDYGSLLEQLEGRVDPVLQVYRKEGYDGISATYTGLTPVVHEAENALLNDLATSFLTATVLVMIVMIVVIRNVAGGMLVMLPNVFPALILFGGMGWLRHAVDIGTVMTASVALGIAVDDTLHFLAWFRRELDKGCTPQIAVTNTMKHCAKAMVQTTAICGLGLLVLALSGFVPTQRFALMMFALLTFALLGDLVLLPALLSGRAGQLFVTKKEEEKRSATTNAPYAITSRPAKRESSHTAEL